MSTHNDPDLIVPRYLITNNRQPFVLGVGGSVLLATYGITISNMVTAPSLTLTGGTITITVILLMAWLLLSLSLLWLAGKMHKNPTQLILTQQELVLVPGWGHDTLRWRWRDIHHFDVMPRAKFLGSKQVTITCAPNYPHRTTMQQYLYNSQGYDALITSFGFFRGYSNPELALLLNNYLDRYAHDPTNP